MYRESYGALEAAQMPKFIATTYARLKAREEAREKGDVAASPLRWQPRSSRQSKQAGVRTPMASPLPPPSPAPTPTPRPSPCAHMAADAHAATPTASRALNFTEASKVGASLCSPAPAARAVNQAPASTKSVSIAPTLESPLRSSACFSSPARLASPGTPGSNNKQALLESRKQMLEKLTRQMQHCLGRLQDPQMDAAGKEKYQGFINSMKKQMDDISSAVAGSSSWQAHSK